MLIPVGDYENRFPSDVECAILLGLTVCVLH